MRVPIILSDAWSITVGSARQAPDVTKFVNPYQTAMLVKRIMIEDQTNANEPGVVSGTALRLKLNAGKAPLTQQHVPIFCLGIPPNERWNYATTQLTLWNFAKPFYVPAGEPLVPEIYNAGDDFAASTRTARVTIYAQSLAPSEPRPKTRFVPWAAAWIGNKITTMADATEESRESDLVNPFDVPLHVEQFIGRQMQRDPSNPGVNADETPPGDSAAALQYTEVRMVDSESRAIVRDWTPFNHLFQLVDKRSFRVSTVLRPHGYYLVYLNELYSNLTTGTPGIRNAISMLGYREEAI